MGRCQKTMLPMVGLVLLAFSAGCDLLRSAPTVTPRPTETATLTSFPTATFTATPTPTLTFTPSDTPPPTATPRFSIELCPECTAEPEIEGFRFRSTFGEPVLNEMLAAEIANAAGVSWVYLDVVPGGLVISTGIYVFGQWIDVDAHTLLDVQDGTLLIYVMDASVGPFNAPGAAIGVINNSIIPSINTMIYNAIQEYNPYDVIYLVDVHSTNTDLTVEYVARPPN